jgi:hypothetical protein
MDDCTVGSHMVVCHEVIKQNNTDLHQNLNDLLSNDFMACRCPYHLQYKCATQQVLHRIPTAGAIKKDRNNPRVTACDYVSIRSDFLSSGIKLSVTSKSFFAVLITVPDSSYTQLMLMISPRLICTKSYLYADGINDC